MAEHSYTRQMHGERLARAALALDAIYSAMVGLSIILLRARIGGLIGLPGVLIGALGAALVGWAYVLLAQTVRIDWRRGVGQTVAANTAASLALVTAAAFHPARGARLLLGFVALDAKVLAVAEGISLIRDRGRS
jgi:hypothetical protein